MIKKIKELYERLRGAVGDFLLKVRVTIHLITEWLKLAVQWLKFPNWYFVLIHIAMPLMAFEIVGTWAGFVLPAVGMFVYLYKRDI